MSPFDYHYMLQQVEEKGREQILFTRYNLMHAHGMITHVITRLNAVEPGAIYGDHLRSRMREMFNLIAFQPVSRDKRK